MTAKFFHRPALLAACAAAWLALSACSEAPEAAQNLAPVEISHGTSCSLDGMLLADYAGPKAQVHYAGQDQPTFFCDTVELFHTLLVGEQVKVVRAVYVQDMGATDWDKPEGHWIDAKQAYFVVGGKRHGSMGPTIGSFAQEAPAQAFIKDWGGKLLRFDEIKLDMVDMSGGALHDKSM